MARDFNKWLSSFKENIADDNGSLSGTLVYYVKPNVNIDLTNTANGITKKGNVGYTADGGTWFPAIEKQQYTKDETYTFTFKALPDVIEDKPGYTKPDGYVTVAIVPTERAKDPTVKYYWVNPNKKVTIPATDPTPAKEYYKFIRWDKNFSTAFHT